MNREASDDRWEYGSPNREWGDRAPGTRGIVAMLDKASVNAGAAVQAKRGEWERRGLALHYLPPRSPRLNLIEIVWREVKQA